MNPKYKKARKELEKTFQEFASLLNLSKEEKDNSFWKEIDSVVK